LGWFVFFVFFRHCGQLAAQQSSHLAMTDERTKKARNPFLYWFTR
jgi:hypothetical protein